MVTRRTAIKMAVGAAIGARSIGAQVTLERFPYLQDVGSDHAVILWTTRQRGSGLVTFSGDNSFAQSVPAIVREFLPPETGRPFAYYQYQARLPGLKDGTRYVYRVFVDGQNLTPASTPADELNFMTPGKGAVNFLAYGDSGEGRAQQFQLAQLMNREDASFILHTGDIVYPDGSFSNYEAYYFAVYRDLASRIPIFTVPGNHDYYAPSATPYLASTSAPLCGVRNADVGRYYSFDWGDVHFVALDTNDPLTRASRGDRAMLDWLELDLRSSRNYWKVVFFHHPPYALSPQHENDEVLALVRQYIMPILERNNVSLLLAGHDHNYQRFVPLLNGNPVGAGQGIQQIVTGGGGAILHALPNPSPMLAKAFAQFHYTRVSVDGPKAKISAVGIDGKELDQFVFGPAPGLIRDGVFNAASFASTCAPGSLISIYGHNLAHLEDRAPRFPLPTDLGGVKISIGSQTLPLVYVSTDQVNAQLPYQTGDFTLTVTTPNGSATVPIHVSDTAPGIFGGFTPAVVHTNGSLVTPENPAEAGEYLSIYLTGLGRVNGTIAPGQAAPSSPLLSATAPVQVLLDSVSVTPSFAGLAPGFAGLNQIVVQIPQSTRNGLVLLRVSAGNAQSNAVSLPVGFQDLAKAQKFDVAELFGRRERA